MQHTSRPDSRAERLSAPRAFGIALPMLLVALLILCLTGRGAA